MLSIIKCALHSKSWNLQKFLFKINLSNNMLKILKSHFSSGNIKKPQNKGGRRGMGGITQMVS